MEINDDNNDDTTTTKGFIPVNGQLMTLQQQEKLVKCDYCKKINALRKLYVCSKCKNTFYCDNLCQRHGWLSGHYKVCSVTHTNTSY